MNREELAWAAGLFDGEGYVGLTSKNKNIKLSICMTTREPLDRFQKVFRVGRVGGPYERPTNSRAKPLFQFYVTSFEHAQHIVAQMWRWLSPHKQTQGHKALTEWLEWRQRGAVRQTVN